MYIHVDYLKQDTKLYDLNITYYTCIILVHIFVIEQITSNDYNV